MAEASENPIIHEPCRDINIVWIIEDLQVVNDGLDNEAFSLFQAEWFLRVCPFYYPHFFRLFLRRKSFVNSAPFDHHIRIVFTVEIEKADSDSLVYTSICKDFLFHKDFESTPRLFIDDEELEDNIKRAFDCHAILNIWCKLSLLNIYGYEGSLSLSSSGRRRQEILYVDNHPNQRHQEIVSRRSISRGSPRTSEEEEIVSLRSVSPAEAWTSSEDEIVPGGSMSPDSPKTSEKEIVPKMSMPHGIQTLSQNLKILLDTGCNADVRIEVKEQTFQAHQLILEARSPVFASMFQHDMKEKSSRVINIDDCHPDSFKDFLLYLYSGKVDHIMASSAPSIYHIADKYDVNELMDACKDCMSGNMSVDSFCDIVLIAAMHNEELLMKTAIEYFIVHAEDILQSQGWRAFLPEHVTVANELLQKLFLRDTEYRDKIKNN